MILTISGPTAVGKNTLVKELLKNDSSLHMSVSFTTRPPRPGEMEGINYHFVTKGKFLTLRDKGHFIEWAENHGHFYGTSEEELRAESEDDRDIVLEIDYQGVRQIKKKFPSAISIFILPPTFSSLEERIRGRGTENEIEIQSRLKRAKQELGRLGEFEYWVTNDKIKDAVADLLELIKILRQGKEPDAKRFRMVI